MTRLTRKNLKVFASNALNNGVFGSLQANNPTTTNDVEQIQSLPAWGNGWDSATESSEMLPPLEEAQAINYVNTYQTAYILQEGIPEWLSTCEYHVGSWVKSNASGKNIVYESLSNNNVGNPVTDTSVWSVKDLGDAFSVGDIKQSLRTSNHENWFICNGQAISRTDFSELFSIIGTNFGDGDGSTTFNLPDYRGKFLRGLGGDSESDMYTTQSEGLPNISGTFISDCYRRNETEITGAFSLVREDSNHNESEGSNNTNIVVEFDASDSSSIYGSSNHVTPVNQAVNYFIKVR